MGIMDTDFSRRGFLASTLVAAAGVIAWRLNARDGDRRRRVSATAAGAAVLARLMFALFDRR